MPPLSPQQIETLRDFALKMLDGYRTGEVGDIDGGWLQDEAVSMGLLVLRPQEEDEVALYYLADWLTPQV